jgi:hypothetical protein
MEALQAISNRDAVLISGLISTSILISDMLYQICEKTTQGSERITCSIAFWPKIYITCSLPRHLFSGFFSYILV